MKKFMLTLMLIGLSSLLFACNNSAVIVQNGDFETGDLSGWTMIDSSSQPLVLNDRFFEYQHPYLQSNDYFLSTKNMDTTLTVDSKPFVLSGLGYVTFLLGGMANTDQTYVALIDADTKELIISENNNAYDGDVFSDNFVRYIWDVRDYLGRKVFFRIVDESSAGYINVDGIDANIDTNEILDNYREDVMLRLGYQTDDLLASANYYVALHSYQMDPAKRYTYHVMGPIGWINDPNGFVTYDHAYHLFYQYHPYSPFWGPMHWGHVKSDDLVKWEYLPVAVAPSVMDAGGGAAFSGSAINIDDDLYIMYTENWPGYQYQVVAKSSDGVHFEKINDGASVIDDSDLPWYANPIDFRDPKIWEHNGKYYAVIGSRQINEYGQVLLFSSNNLTDWSFVGPVIQGSSNTLYKLGFMFECPDLFSLDGHDVLLMSPQQIPGHRNGNGTVYVVGQLNYDSGQLENWNYDNIREIDYGFDFYAPQTMIDPQGRRIMIAWMQSWNRSPMTASLGWAGAMTFPRQLWLSEAGDLMQYPVSEIEQYRQTERTQSYSVDDLTNTEMKGNTIDIELRFNPSEGPSGITVFADESGNGTDIYYENGYVYLDRTDSMGGRYPGEKNNITKAPAMPNEDGSITLRILLDRWSVEVFVNGGESAITSTVYYMPENDNIFLFSQSMQSFELTKWDLDIQ